MAHEAAQVNTGEKVLVKCPDNIKPNIPPIRAAPKTPPILPSTDFLGLSTGAILCFPKSDPTAYAHVSEPQLDISISHARYCPSSYVLVL